MAHAGPMAVPSSCIMGRSRVAGPCIKPAGLPWATQRSRPLLRAYRPGTMPEMMMSSDEDNTTDGTREARHVFTFKRWHVHRNSNERYLRHLFGTLTSVTWRNLTPPMTGIALIATANCCYQTLHEGGYLPSWAPQLQLSDGPLELTSFALSLLLVFRTDSSYGRWNEALDIWNKVRNVSKDMVRDAACWINDPALLSAVVRWTLTYATSLKSYLRERGDVHKSTARLLLPHEHEHFCSLCKDTSSAYPQYALHVLTQAIARAGLVSNREDKLLNAIATLNSCIGSCEKILRYPIPLSYTRHTSRFMVIWLCCLPLALWDDAGWVSIPISIIISFLLLGIEEIGVQIEEPFALLPVRDIVQDIEKDLLAIIASGKEVSALLDKSLTLSAVGHMSGDVLNVNPGDDRALEGPTPATLEPVIPLESVESSMDSVYTNVVGLVEALDITDVDVGTENVLFESFDEGQAAEPDSNASVPTRAGKTFNA